MSSNAYIGLCLTAGTSTATCTAEFSDVTAPGAWQSQDVGIASNVSDEQLYVALQDSADNTAVVKHPDPAATTIDTWTEWEIPLADFAGVNAQALKSMSIGVGDKAALQAGGSGVLYFDDIRLNPSRALPLDPDLLAYYKLDGDAMDSDFEKF